MVARVGARAGLISHREARRIHVLYTRPSPGERDGFWEGGVYSARGVLGGGGG